MLGGFTRVDMLKKKRKDDNAVNMNSLRMKFRTLHSRQSTFVWF